MSFKVIWICLNKKIDENFRVSQIIKTTIFWKLFLHDKINTSSWGDIKWKTIKKVYRINREYIWNRDRMTTNDFLVTREKKSFIFAVWFFCHFMGGSWHLSVLDQLCVVGYFIMKRLTQLGLCYYITLYYVQWRSKFSVEWIF